MGNAVNQPLKDGQVAGYEPHSYWRNRLAGSYNLQGVGLLGRSIAFNRWGYRARRAAANRLITDATGTRVLDVGAGTGHWMRWWHDRGASSVSGVDLTQISVDGLRRDFPQDRVELADISESIPFEGPFEIVSAMDVLLHITGDDAYRRALENLRSVTVPGSRLLLVEPINIGAAKSMLPGANSRTRSLAEMEEAFAVAGWKLERWLPATWLMSNPIEIRPRWLNLTLSAWWAALSLVVRSELGGAILGPPVFLLDQVLCRLPWGPSAKVVLARAI